MFGLHDVGNATRILTCIAFVLSALVITFNLTASQDVNIKVTSVEDDGTAFLHFPIIHSIDIVVETVDGSEVNLEEGTYIEASIQPSKDGSSNFVVVKSKSGVVEVLRIKSILLRY